MKPTLVNKSNYNRNGLMIHQIIRQREHNVTLNFKVSGQDHVEKKLNLRTKGRYEPCITYQVTITTIPSTSCIVSDICLLLETPASL